MSNDIIKEELIAAREEYVKAVKTELMGPGSEFSFPDSEQIGRASCRERV